MNSKPIRRGLRLSHLPILLVPIIVLALGRAAIAEPAAPLPDDGAAPDTTARSVAVTIRRGDTLIGILRSQHLSANYCAALLAAIDGQLDPRRLHIGDRLALGLESAAGITVLHSLALEPARGSPVEVGLPAALREISQTRHEISGTVGRDLATALKAQGLPDSLAMEVAAAAKVDRDVAKSIKPGTTFDILYSEVRLGERRLGNPSLEEITFATDDTEHRLYLYRDSFNSSALVNESGKGVAWLRLERPVRNARLSSPFGWRIHPVFGDRRFHDGIDLATAEGTPVTAAADGIVVDAGWHGNYGQYIRIRHSAGVETTYGHLSAIDGDVRPGKRVTAGQHIGAVGETGVATGPHLYFEVSIDGAYVDPLKLPMAVPIKLSGAELSDLKKQMTQVAARN